MKITEYLETTHYPYSMHNILELVQLDIPEEEIAHFVRDFLKDDMIRVSYGGSCPFNSYFMSIPIEDWRKKHDSQLRAMYRSGVTKKMLLKCHKTMGLIFPKTDLGVSYHNPRTWTCFQIMTFDPKMNMYEYTKNWIAGHRKI
jgi:hypothetical protein